MKRTISLLTVLLIVFSLSACKNNQNQPAETDRSNIIYTEKGEGKNSFYLDLSLQSGEKHYKINTNETTVGSALEKLGIIEGKRGEYGLFVISVEGESHSYDTDGKYWAFYENGDYCATTVDLTEIKENAVYAFRAR